MLFHMVASILFSMAAPITAWIQWISGHTWTALDDEYYENDDENYYYDEEETVDFDDLDVAPISTGKGLPSKVEDNLSSVQQCT